MKFLKTILFFLLVINFCNCKTKKNKNYSIRTENINSEIKNKEVLDNETKCETKDINIENKGNTRFPFQPINKKEWMFNIHKDTLSIFSYLQSPSDDTLFDPEILKNILINPKKNRTGRSIIYNFLLPKNNDECIIPLSYQEIMQIIIIKNGKFSKINKNSISTEIKFNAIFQKHDLDSLIVFKAIFEKKCENCKNKYFEKEVWLDVNN